MRVFGRPISPTCAVQPRIRPNLTRRRGPEGRPPNVSRGRQAWDIDRDGPERRRCATLALPEEILQRHFLFGAGTNPDFDKPFFDSGANHIGIVFLQIVKA